MRWRASLAVDSGCSSEGGDHMPCKQLLLLEGLPMCHASIIRQDIEFSNPGFFLQPCNLVDNLRRGPDKRPLLFYQVLIGELRKRLGDCTCIKAVPGFL